MFLLHVLCAAAERREAAAREENKAQRQARKRAFAGGRRLARRRRDRAAGAHAARGRQLPGGGSVGSCQLEIGAGKSSFPARRRLCLP